MKELQTAKMCIYAVADSDEKDGFKLVLMPPEKKWYMSEQDVMVGMTTVEFYPPEDMSREDMALKAVETLRDRIKQTQADAQMKINQLQVRINELLMITHQPEEQVVNGDNVVHLKEDFIDDLPF